MYRTMVAGCPVDLSRPETYAPRVPDEIFAELRRTKPVLWHADGERPGFWAVFRYRDIVSISTNTSVFSSGQGVFLEDIGLGEGIPGSLLTADPPRHGDLRSSFNKWFSKTAVGELEEWLRTEACKIMAAAGERDGVEFVYDMAARLPLMTICEFLGVPGSDREQMLSWGDAVIRAHDGASLTAALTAIGEYGLDLARTAGGATISPLITEMYRSLTRDDSEFIGQFSQLLVAGNETTRTLLSNIVIELCGNASLFNELKADTGLIPLAIEEFLRWTSPIYYMRRTAVRDHTIDGQQIRAGDPVVMYYVSANRDEEIFTDPDTLDIRRQPNPHLSFGVGRHNCLGAQLARLETRIFLEEFLRAFSGVSLAGEPRRFRSNVVNGWEAVPVSLAP